MTWRMMMRSGLCATLVLGLAVAAGGAGASPTSTGERFQGARAIGEAGRYLTDALGYDFAYDPGRIAVQFAQVYDGGFATIVRFSAEDRHQVVLRKREDEAGTPDGGRCSEVRLTVEHFASRHYDPDTRRPLTVNPSVDRTDDLTALVCVRRDDDVAVVILGSRLDVDVAARNRFASPFSVRGSGSDGGGGR